MKLVACPHCHAQYDVAEFGQETVTCRCGTAFAARPPVAKDAEVTRCAACGALVGETETICSYCQAEVTRRPEPAGPVCPECYASNPRGARHCTACGIAFLPQPVRSSPEALECPVCEGARLTARSLGGLWVDECPQCLGIWAPGDIMDRLVERVREKRRREGTPATGHAARGRRATWQEGINYRRCPECSGMMQRRNFGRRSGVIVDWCGSHGTWLDAREMEDVAAFVLEGGLELQGAGSPEGAGDAGHSWNLPADPERAAAMVAAQQLIAEERARTLARERARGIDPDQVWRGLGDFLAHLLKQ